LDESVEQEEEVIIDNVENPVLKNADGTDNLSEEPVLEIPPNKEEEIPEIVPSIKNIDNEPVITRLTFNDTDSVLDENNSLKEVSAPKTIEQLEKISMERSIQRKLEEEESDDSDTIKIMEPVDLSGFDVLDMDTAGNAVSSEDPFIEFEEL
jgi:hypothetical protein